MVRSKTTKALMRVRGYMKKYGFNKSSIYVDSQTLDHQHGVGLKKSYYITLFLTDDPEDIWQSTHSTKIERCTTQALDYIRNEARANNG